MALVHCKECKKEISDQATSCPNCGYKPGLNIGCGGVIVLLFIAYFIFTSNSNKQPIKDTGTQNHPTEQKITAFDKNYSAASACMLFIKKQLNDPDTADFDLTKEAYVSELNDSFIVQRHIRAKNGFGAKVKKVMECKMTYKAGNWYPIYIKEIK